MKKTAALILAVLMVFSLSACETSHSKEKEAEGIDTRTEVERFAEREDMSLELAKSLEMVLSEIDLRDTSRVGTFQYDLADVYNWKQIEDWASGERYSAWMAMEHVLYFYVKDDTVVGVRDGNGNIFYLVETPE